MCSMQGQMLWRLLSVFGKSADADYHAGLGGVQTHENGIHLYKSDSARYVVVGQIQNYMWAASFLGLVSGVSYLCIMPLILMTVQAPRKISTMAYFCWHAELLPHTEQVVFHKVTWFGKVERYYVDIRNLEKVDSQSVDAPMMWAINMFDPDLIFRDAASGEVFVFDKLGFWNQQALEHPLLY